LARHLDRRPGFEGLGTLAPGAVGDVALLDPTSEWIVEPERFASLGRNTPLAGERLRGRVIATVVDGVVVHETNAVAAL
jgi:dihydroorotase